MGVLQRWGGGLSRRKRAALIAQQEAEARRAAEEAARIQAEEAARKAAEEAAARQAAEQAAAQRAAEEAARRQAEEAAARQAAEQQAAAAAQRQAEEAARQAILQRQMEAAKIPFAPENAPEKPARPTFFQPPVVATPTPAVPLPAIAPPVTPPPIPKAPLFQPIFNNALAQDLLPYQPFQPVPTNFFTSMLGGGKPNFPQGTQPVGFFQNMVSNPVTNVDPFAPQVFTNPMTTYSGPVAFQPVAPVTPIATDIFALRPLGGLV